MPRLPGALPRAAVRAAGSRRTVTGEGTWCHHRIRARRGLSAGTGPLTGPGRTAKVPKPAPPPPRINHRPVLTQGAKGRPGSLRLESNSNHSSRDATTGNHPPEGSSPGDRRPGSSRHPDRGQPGAHPRAHTRKAHTLKAGTREPHTRAALIQGPHTRAPRIPEHSTAAPTASHAIWPRPSQASFRSVL